MSIPRWVCAYGNSQMIEEPTGNYVHIDDHVAALAQAKADAVMIAGPHNYRQGQRDALASQTSESRPHLPANGIPATSVAPAGEDYGALMYEQGQRDALADQFSIGAVLVQRLGGTVIITREEMLSVPLNMTRWEQGDGAIVLSVSEVGSDER